jgi:multicomponent Na+:H+ antiporter subunit G
VIRPVAAALLLAAGVAFVTIASLGVARMPDVFQRMHAATKAGGIGTTLVVLGVLVAGGVARPLTGVLTIAFMLLTLSVASQLLARAAYMSGAALHGLDGRDALAGVLDRAAGPPDEDGELPAGGDGPAASPDARVLVPRRPG